jgi:hypothetical protein
VLDVVVVDDLAGVRIAAGEWDPDMAASLAAGGLRGAAWTPGGMSAATFDATKPFSVTWRPSEIRTDTGQRYVACRPRSADAATSTSEVRSLALPSQKRHDFRRGQPT